MADMFSVVEMDARLETSTITPDLLEYMVEKIVRAINPQKIILFGSRARGDDRDDSDVDLFIVYDGDESIRDIRRRIDMLLWGRHFGVDLFVRTPHQVKLNLDDGNPFYTHHIFGEGKVLYERKP